VPEQLPPGQAQALQRFASGWQLLVPLVQAALPVGE
jgi:hypothetical protein